MMRSSRRWLARRPKDEPGPELRRWTGQRALTLRESEVLAFLLAPDDERLVPRRRQAETATVSGGCGCGCPSIDLTVDRARSSPATGLGRPAVTAVSREAGPADEVWWLQLWVAEGWLEGIEVSYIDTPPAVLPAPVEFGAPAIEPAAIP
jgi:hypothetical protein